MTDRFPGDERDAMPSDELHPQSGRNDTGQPAGGEAGEATDVICPFCRSHDTELVSLFGGQLSTDQFYCRACHSYFERFARDDEHQDER